MYAIKNYLMLSDIKVAIKWLVGKSTSADIVEVKLKVPYRVIEHTKNIQYSFDKEEFWNFLVTNPKYFRILIYRKVTSLEQLLLAMIVHIL